MTQLIMHYMLSLMCHSLGGSTLCFPSSSLLWYNACAILNNAHLYERDTQEKYAERMWFETMIQFRKRKLSERDSLLSSWTLRCFHPAEAKCRAMQVNSTTLPSCTDFERHPSFLKPFYEDEPLFTDLVGLGLAKHRPLLT